MLQSREHIGRFDRELTFIQKIVIDGDSNEDRLTGWEEIDTNPTVSARKEERTGNEGMNADRLAYTQPTLFVIRYRDDITVEMRAVCDSKVYEITSVTEEGRRRFLHIMTTIIDNEYFT